MKSAVNAPFDFRISHRFGEFNTGLDNFYGLDGPASITLSFDYSFDGPFPGGHRPQLRAKTVRWKPEIRAVSPNG